MPPMVNVHDRGDTWAFVVTSWDSATATVDGGRSGTASSGVVATHRSRLQLCSGDVQWGAMGCDLAVCACCNVALLGSIAPHCVCASAAGPCGRSGVRVCCGPLCAQRCARLLWAQRCTASQSSARFAAEQLICWIVQDRLMTHRENGLRQLPCIAR